MFSSNSCNFSFQYYEWKLWIAHNVQDWVTKMVDYAKEVYQEIRSAESLGAGLLAAGKKIMGDAANWVMSNVLFIEELCASAGMDKYDRNKGFCFKANATIYLGGKNEGTEPTKFDDKQICVGDLTSAAFWKDIAKQILEYVFPDITEIFSTAKEIKDKAFSQTRKEKKLASTRGKADQDAKKFDTYTEDDAAV